jgi:YHS domain-containing protein
VLHFSALIIDRKDAHQSVVYKPYRLEKGSLRITTDRAYRSLVLSLIHCPPNQTSFKIKIENNNMNYIKLSTIALITATSFITVSCGDKKAEEPASKDNAEQREVSVKPYPLDHCVVSGEKLGSMGEPHVFVYEGQEIKQCCDNCEPKFRKDPEKYLKMINEPKTSEHQHQHQH